MESDETIVDPHRRFVDRQIYTLCLVKSFKQLYSPHKSIIHKFNHLNPWELKAKTGCEILRELAEDYLGEIPLDLQIIELDIKFYN
jgi:hypothetical protein